MAGSELDMEAARDSEQSGRLDMPPALIIVAFADPAPSGGGNVAAAIARTVPLLAFARADGWRVVHARMPPAEHAPDAAGPGRRGPRPRTLTEAAPLSRIVPALAPVPGGLVLRRRRASAFLGTGLAGWLAMRHVDRVAVVGCTTSDGVRATVLDALQHSFRTLCLEDCVGDRTIGPHEAGLRDMGRARADLMTSAALMAAWPERD